METLSRFTMLITPHSFKSYYVVWKPQANDGRYHQHIRFKSYYVVWKHDFSKRWKEIDLKGLNRTM